MMPQVGFAAKAAFRGASSQAVELWERRYAARRGIPMSKLPRHDGIALPA
jgi:hypothetical protein